MIDRQGRGTSLCAFAGIFTLATMLQAAEPASADEANAWSERVNGLQARLSFATKKILNGTPIVTTYLELRNVSDSANVMEIPWEDVMMQYTVRDGAGKVVPPANGPWDETRAPFGTIRLPFDSCLRLPIVSWGAGVPKDHAAHLDLGCDYNWNFKRGDKGVYDLSAKFTVKETKKRHWFGTMEIPKCRIPTSEENVLASSVSSDLWSDYWRRQHKDVKMSELKLGWQIDGKAIRAPSGIVVLPVKVTNLSKETIQATMAHEWHGGEWPPTDLYASVTPVKATKSMPFVPVYLAGEDQDAARETKIGPGKSVNVDLRMDWPGSGSVPAQPLMESAAGGTYNVRVLMVFEVDGQKQYVAGPATSVELAAPDTEAPGVGTLVEASTDVAVVEVKSTQPTKAGEGARDTAKLEVIQTLKGPLKKADVVPLYYHLLFKDREKQTLEKPKFEKGKRYIVFLRAHLVTFPEGKSYPLGEEYQFGKFTKDGSVYFKEFELTDQWLAVVDEHPELTEKIAKMAKSKDK
jgi:hypothetical protein